MNSLVFCLLSILALVSVLVSATPCSTHVSAYYFYQPLPTCPVLAFISQEADQPLCPAPIQSQPLTNIPDYQPVSLQLASAQLIASAKSAKYVALIASVLFATIALASLAAIIVLLCKSLNTIQLLQNQNLKNIQKIQKIQKNARAEQQEIIQVLDQIDSVLQYELSCTDEGDEEVSLMPLATAAEPVKKPKLVGFDDVVWDDFSFATRSKIHQAISVGALDEEQLFAFERDAPVVAARPFEQRQLDPQKELTYADVHWDKYSYGARAQIFYKITNESMTAADLLAFEFLDGADEAVGSVSSLNESACRCSSIEPCQAPPDQVNFKWQDYSYATRAKAIEDSESNAVVPLNRPDYDRKVTFSDVKWGQFSNAMRSRIFDLVSNEELSFDELKDLEFEAKMGNPRLENCNEQDLIKLAQWEPLPMDKLVKLYADTRVPPDDGLTQLKMPRLVGFEQASWRDYSYDSRARIYQSICTAGQLPLSFPSSAMQPVVRLFEEKQRMNAQTILTYNDIDWDRLSFATSSILLSTDGDEKLLEQEDCNEYDERELLDDQQDGSFDDIDDQQGDPYVINDQKYYSFDDLDDDNTSHSHIESDQTCKYQFNSSTKYLVDPSELDSSSSKLPKALKRCQSSAEELSLAALSSLEQLTSRDEMDKYLQVPDSQNGIALYL